MSLGPAFSPKVLFAAFAEVLPLCARENRLDQWLRGVFAVSELLASEAAAAARHEHKLFAQTSFARLSDDGCPHGEARWNRRV